MAAAGLMKRKAIFWDDPLLYVSFSGCLERGKHIFQSVKVLLYARKQEAFGGQGNNSVFLPEVRFEIIQHDK